MLLRNGQEQSLQSWGIEIVEQMASLCAILDAGEDGQPNPDAVVDALIWDQDKLITTISLNFIVRLLRSLSPG